MGPSWEQQSIGSALVIGGCGFVGFHIVQHLLKDSRCGQITVVSRNPKENRLDGISYVQLDLTNAQSVKQVIDEINPEVIFHVAAPRAVDGYSDESIFFRTIVEGTQNVIQAATANKAVKALVFTSTPAVHAGYEHFDLSEDAPMWQENSKTFSYYKAKALGDTLVLRANKVIDTEGRGLRTATLRLPMVYGERDNQAIPGQLEAFRKGQTKIQLGNGQNYVEPLYAPNAAIAHISAAKALLASQTTSLLPKVDGEAFFITNGDPQPFWAFSRRIWQLVGDKTESKEIIVVSGKVALTLSSMVEWAFFLFTLGFKKPPLNVTRLYIQYSIYNTTYNIRKARERLGYNPTVDVDASLRSSIASTLERDPRFADLRLEPSQAS
jgi:sterol-4alpha-carboxylate 3-dehydrogenase (decarboxylating)